MKILISGTTGFIGKHLVKKLKKDHELFAIVRSSTDLNFLKKEGIEYYTFNDKIGDLISFMQEKSFDGVIHLASLFLPQHKPEDIKNLIDSNVLFSTILLEASAESKIPWFVNTGTFWQHYNNKSYSPVNLYAATKQAFENISKYYTETNKINFVTVKLSDTFGPDDTRPKIFNLWLKISETKENLPMSPGRQIIDISHIDNVIDGYEKIIHLLHKDTKNKLNGKSFAIKAKKRLSLKKLSNLFEKVTGEKLNINWGEKEYRPREVMVPWKKGKTIPGWKENVSLNEGIKKTFNKNERK